MENKTFDLFCPKCNILVETKIITEGQGEFISDAVNPMDEVDAPYNREYYYISLCPRCSQPFMIRESLYGVPGEFETVTEKSVLYPNNSNIPVENLPPLVKLSYEQAIKSFSASLFEPCVLMCRKTLEVVCNSFNAKGRNLYKRLVRLRELGHIEQRLLDWTHEIRSIGNDAAHDVDSTIDKEDARDSLDLTEAILLYIFSLSSRFDNFKTRRLKKESKKS